jgi:hypothetical protein
LVVGFIVVNLVRKKAAIFNIKQTAKIMEKSKVFTKSIVPLQGAHVAQKNEAGFWVKLLKNKFCSWCISPIYFIAKCWILHPELRPANAKTPKMTLKK